jgi:hypothetical protein
MSLWKNRTKCSQNHFFVKINSMSLLWKKRPKIFGYLWNFWKTSQSKKAFIGRKFAQSGHSDWTVSTTVFFIHELLASPTPPPSFKAMLSEGLASLLLLHFHISLFSRSDVRWPYDLFASRRRTNENWTGHIHMYVISNVHSLLVLRQNAERQNAERQNAERRNAEFHQFVVLFKLSYKQTQHWYIPNMWNKTV